jgi:hypothetical protein
MTATKMFAASTAALIVACVAGWAVTDTQARTPVPMARVRASPQSVSATNAVSHFTSNPAFTG